MTSRPAAPPELTAGLSRAFVAVVVGLDDEFEHRMPHRTTRGGGRGQRMPEWNAAYVFAASADMPSAASRRSVWVVSWRSGGGVFGASIVSMTCLIGRL